ncbi:MAG: hypothetical protein ACUVQR_02965 [Thermogutta sp.]
MSMIPAELLIKLLEEKDLVDAEVLAEIRQQVAQSRKGPKPIHAASLAKILVDRGYLSRLLAQRLMAKLEAEWAEKPRFQKPDPLILKPFSTPATPSEDELRLAEEEPVINLIPIEDEKAPSPPPLPQPSSSQPPPQVEPQPAEVVPPSMVERSPFEDLLSELAPEPVPTAAPFLTPEAWKKRRKNPWESPWFLFGSGSLLILVFAGVVLLWSLNRRTGDELLAEADADFYSGSYTQAVYKYDKFLKDFPQHPQASLAQIRQGLARIRQALETSDPVSTFQILKEIVPELSKLPDFHAEADAEMTAVLPGLAQQIAEQALKNRDPSLITICEETLAFCDKYIPKERLPVAKLADIQATVELAKRSISEKDALATTIKHIADCRDSGRLDEAYEIYERFSREYPTAKSDPQLQQVMSELAEAEKDRVHFEAAQPIESSPLPSLPVQQIALYSSWVGGPAPFPENSITILSDQESVYGVQMASGKMLWQRAIGGAFDGSFIAHYPRIAIDGEETVALPERFLQAVVLVATASGQVKKIVPLGERPSPWVTTERSYLLVLGQSGKIHVVNPLESQNVGSFCFPQPLAYPPLIDPASRRAFVLGEHSHLFVIRLDSRDCEQVVYLGHERGQVCAPPALVAGYLIIPERQGPLGGRLRVVEVNNPDQLRVIQILDLPRPVASQLQVLGMRFAAITNDGQVRVYQLRGGTDKQPFGLLAEGKTPDPSPSQKAWAVPRFVLFHKDQLIAADTALTLFELQASAGKLVPRWVALQETIAVSPPSAQDNTIMSMHRYPDRPGLFIAAVDGESGRVFWETQLSDPPLQEVRVSDDSPRLEAIGQSGVIYRFDVTISEPSLVGVRPDRVLRYPGLIEGKKPHGCLLPSGHWVIGACPDQELFVLRRQQDRTEVTTVPLPRPLSSIPVAFCHGVLIGLQDGSLALLDVATKQLMGQPYQGEVAPGEKINWSDLVPMGEKTILAANSAGWLLKLDWIDQPSGHFEVRQRRMLDSPLVSPICRAGEHIVAVDAERKLLAISARDLTTVASQQLESKVVWGPWSVGPVTALATANGALILLSPTMQATKVDLNDEIPVGIPAVLGEDLLIAARQGSLLHINPMQGTVVRRVDLPATCATGPVLVGETIVLGSPDGRWLMVPKAEVLHDSTKN